MANILLKYLEERHKSAHRKVEEPKTVGPVITISRSFGCPANLCATDLAELLTRIEGNSNEPWKVISKEILEESAKELGLEPDKIEYIFQFEKRSAIDEILEALSSKYYKSERKIRKTIREVIHAFGEQGRVIIVGRAGASILYDIKNSLHVRLIAPLDYRIEGVSRRHKISHREAKKLTLEMDKKRAMLRKDFAGKRVSDVDYDLIFNCKTIGSEEIVQLIAKAAQMRKMV
ncbi:MAG: cytidylate kinase-like family protein [Bacteroidales bacterium]|jgi:cytidylate kinase|nr:cytidylate kinase-like family protein [Bacteroidales bacterium]